MNTAAMLQQIQGMEQRLFEMQEKLDGFHALLSTTLTKFSQLEQMVTLQKVQQRIQPWWILGRQSCGPTTPTFFVWP